ncbi:MAG: kynureninase [Candidatus Promineifilaceae bacterium]|nr:kynureninase [Candidatus Promineifilaceae bacterium]
MPQFPLTRAAAQQIDERDPLASFRDRFIIADDRLLYMLGNSLGRLPKAAAERIEHLVHHEWGERLIRSWNESWIDLPAQTGDKIAELLGAGPGEIIIADSTSVNLYKVAIAALRLRPGRRKIVTDNLNFPSDLYVLQGALSTVRGPHFLQIVPSPDDVRGPVEGLARAIDEDTALVTLSHTVFKSAYIYELAAITRLAHEAGALTVWDVSHSVGAMPLDFTGAGVDFAVGCTYKYLNGGPGAPAFLFVREELQEEAQNPISGWMGQDRPFDFDLEYRSAPGLRRFLTGTPPILSLAAIEAGVDLLLEAGMEHVRAKSSAQTAYLIALWEARLAPMGFELRSPRERDRRGSHVSFGHPEGLRISQALKKEMKVLPDFRSPDTLRFSVAPLYTRYVDLFDAVERLRTVVVDRLYEKYSLEAPAVT